MGQIGIDGDALHAVFLHGLHNFAHGVHFFVRINTPEPHELFGIGPAEFQHTAVVGGETVRRFRVAAGDDAQLHANGIKVIHDFRQALGLAGIKTDDLARGLEHGAVPDAVDNLRRIGSETKIDNLHRKLLSVLKLPPAFPEGSMFLPFPRRNGLPDEHQRHGRTVGYKGQHKQHQQNHGQNRHGDTLDLCLRHA